MHTIILRGWGGKGKVKKKSTTIQKATRPTRVKKKAVTPRSSSKVELRVALAQMNSVVGDFQHNASRIKDCLEEAALSGADLVLFPELALTGYPPEDLLLKRDFVAGNEKALQRLAKDVKGIVAVIGYVERVKTDLYNSAALIAGGKVLGTYRKMILPNYGVFDEKRYFLEGREPVRFVLKGATMGLTICEDIWQEEGPGKQLCGAGQADVLLNISSSPYYKGKGKAREEMIRKRARQYKAHVLYANLVGGQDELVFDGHSLIAAPDGTFIQRGNSFVEEMIYADLKIRPKSAKEKSRKAAGSPIKTWRVPVPISWADPKPALAVRRVRKLGATEEVYHALVLGTRDYMGKNGFTKAVIALSGGIDSALTTAIATAAIGEENVVGVSMPSPYSSRGSIDDSKALARNLGIRIISLPIREAMQAYDKILKKPFEGLPLDITEENMQARIRGTLMMALSNKMGWLVLTTGNKSEVSVGYCTLYGDMAGGFAVIKDVPKIWVYQLSRWINKDAGRELIPKATITKEPSAELRPDQKDTDSLPPYSLLDKVLARYIEEDRGIEELKGMGLSMKEVKRIVKMVDASEYKRRQGPPGIKITPKAFGKDRRLPITNRYEP
jgi:NAD+ synthase (glutamine-hydrolysing)|tara:strand:- start:707 stop:2545 length:1839 start_codon:yes stop_codon:yes gene_type:complete